MTTKTDRRKADGLYWKLVDAVDDAVTVQWRLRRQGRAGRVSAIVKMSITDGRFLRDLMSRMANE
jgi:hypothetical protein